MNIDHVGGSRGHVPRALGQRLKSEPERAKPILERYAALLAEDRMKDVGLPVHEWQRTTATSSSGLAEGRNKGDASERHAASSWCHVERRVVVVNGERRVIDGCGDAALSPSNSGVSRRTLGPGCRFGSSRSNSTSNHCLPHEYDNYSNSGVRGAANRLTSPLDEGSSSTTTTLRSPNDSFNSAPTASLASSMVHAAECNNTWSCNCSGDGSPKCSHRRDGAFALWARWSNTLNMEAHTRTALSRLKLAYELDNEWATNGSDNESAGGSVAGQGDCYTSSGASSGSISSDVVDEFPNVVQLQEDIHNMVRLKTLCTATFNRELHSFSHQVLPAAPIFLDLCDELDVCTAQSIATRQRLRDAKESVGTVIRVLAMERRRRHLVEVNRIVASVRALHDKVDRAIALLGEMHLSSAARLLGVGADVILGDAATRAPTVTLAGVLHAADAAVYPLSAQDLEDIIRSHRSYIDDQLQLEAGAVDDNDFEATRGSPPHEQALLTPKDSEKGAVADVLDASGAQKPPVNGTTATAPGDGSSTKRLGALVFPVGLKPPAGHSQGDFQLLRTEQSERRKQAVASLMTAVATVAGQRALYVFHRLRESGGAIILNSLRTELGDLTEELSTTAERSSCPSRHGSFARFLHFVVTCLSLGAAPGEEVNRVFIDAVSARVADTLVPRALREANAAVGSAGTEMDEATTVSTCDAARPSAFPASLTSAGTDEGAALSGGSVQGASASADSGDAESITSGLSIAAQLTPAAFQPCIVRVLSALSACLRGVVHLEDLAAQFAAGEDAVFPQTTVATALGDAPSCPFSSRYLIGDGKGNAGTLHSATKPNMQVEEEQDHWIASLPSHMRRALRLACERIGSHLSVSVAQRMLEVMSDVVTVLPLGRGHILDALLVYRLLYRFTYVCQTVSPKAARSARSSLFKHCVRTLESRFAVPGIEALEKVIQNDMCQPFPVSLAMDLPHLHVLLPRDESTADAEDVGAYLLRPPEARATLATDHGPHEDAEESMRTTTTVPQTVLNPFFSDAVELAYMDVERVDETSAASAFNPGACPVFSISSILVVKRVLETAAAASVLCAAAPILIHISLRYAATFLVFLVSNFATATTGVPLDEEPLAPTVQSNYSSIFANGVTLPPFTAGIGAGAGHSGDRGEGSSSGSGSMQGAVSSFSSSSVIRMVLTTVPESVKQQWRLLRRAAPPVTSDFPRFPNTPCQFWRQADTDRSRLYAAVERSTMAVGSRVVAESFKAVLSALTPLISPDQLPALSTAAQALRGVALFGERRCLTRLAQQLLPCEALVTLIEQQYVVSVVSEMAVVAGRLDPSTLSSSHASFSSSQSLAASTLSFFKGKRGSLPSSSSLSGVQSAALSNAVAEALKESPTDISAPVRQHLQSFHALRTQLEEVFCPYASSQKSDDDSLGGDGGGEARTSTGLQRVLDYCIICFAYGFVEGLARITRRLNNLELRGGAVGMASVHSVASLSSSPPSSRGEKNGGEPVSSGPGGRSSVHPIGQLMEVYGLSHSAIACKVRQQMIFDAAALQKELVRVHPTLDELRLAEYLGGYAGAAASEEVEEVYRLIKMQHQMYTIRQLMALGEKESSAIRRDIEQTLQRLANHEDQLPFWIAE